MKKKKNKIMEDKRNTRCRGSTLIRIPKNAYPTGKFITVA